MNDINNYAIIFYKESRVVGITAFDSTLEQARGAANIIASSSSEYLPNGGNFDEVSFTKTCDINQVMSDALEKVNQA